MSNELAKHNGNTQAMSVFSSSNNFEHAQRIAKMLSASTLVPAEYQNNVSNTLVALEMANRVGASPLQVMQNLNIINGRPSWSSPFIIAAINTCGRFAPLKFEFEQRGKKNLQYEYWTGSKAANNRRKESGTIDINDTACRAYTTDASGEVLYGPWVSIEIAVHEGWYTKSDSKWKTMPEVMLRYRAAAFFGRLYCPEILLGMQTSEELHDITDTPASVAPAKPSAIEVINQQVSAAAAPPTQQPEAAPHEYAEAEIVPGESQPAPNQENGEELV